MPIEQISDEQADISRTLRTVRVATVGLFLITLIGLVYFARDFLLPVVLAFMLALTLSPIVRYLQKRGIAPPISAVVLVLIFVGFFSAGAYLLTDPITEWIERAPEISRTLNQKLTSLRKPVEAVVKASEQVETITEGTSSPAVQKVVVQQPGLISVAANNLVSIASTAGVTFVLLLFLLASGTMFYEKMIGIMPTFRDKKRALTIAYDGRKTSRDIS